MINEYTNTFKWFFGIVEDREDPKMLGRVRVRVHNLHTPDKVQLPTDLLPWATIVMAPTSAGIREVGISPTGLMVGSTVFGFFADGEMAQVPMILGTIAGIPNNDEDQHEVTQLARGKNNVAKAILHPEPDSKYKAKYPYNKVITTEGGHAIEIDDTPGAERIHVFHKSGTYVEIDSEGTRVDKTVGDQYSIMVGDHDVRIMGDLDIEVNSNARVQIDGNADVIVYGDLDAKVFGETSLVAEGSLTVMSQSDVIVRSAANVSVYTPGTLSLESLGNLTIRGGQIDIETPLLNIKTGATVSTTAGSFQITSGSIGISTPLMSTTAGSVSMSGGPVTIETPVLTIDAGTTVSTTAGMHTITANPLNINPA